jgi:molybdate transport repressor ModE-like protein
MDLRQLNAVVAIADHGSFSAAARALYTVQSNVSGHVARLERELGVLLVDRQRGQLTDEGTVVVERARRILREIDEIAAELASRGDEVHGDARLGLIATSARWLVPPLLDEVATTHPGIHLTIHEGTTTILVSRLLAGHLDGALAHLPIDEPELEVQPLFDEDLMVYVSDGHPLDVDRTLTMADLAAVRLFLPPRGTSLRRAIDRAAAAAGAELVPQAEIDGVRLLASLAQEGYGAAVVPASALPSWITGPFRRIRVEGLGRRSIGWVQRRRPAPGPPSRAVREILERIILREGPALDGLHLDP